MIKSYSDCAAMFAMRKRKLARNTYLEIASDDARADERPAYAVKLHQTRIVTYHPDDRVELNSGGWRTVTTKERINAFSPISVYQDKGIWYARDRREEREGHGEQCVFADGITFHANGRVTGAGDDPKKELKLRRAVRAYATALVSGTLDGTIGPPDAGDCFMCQLRGDAGVTMGDHSHDRGDHLRSHISEKYYVPSLLYNAARGGMQGKSDTPGGWGSYPTVSAAALDTLQRAWDGERRLTWRHVAEPQLIAAVANYIFHRLSMTPTRAIYRR